MVPPSSAMGDHSRVAVQTPEAHRQQGKAPPVSEFTWENPEYSEMLGLRWKADTIGRSPVWMSVTGMEPFCLMTRNALLYAQLRDALWYELMKTLAVSGSTKYQEFCMAAKNEDKHLAELWKRQQYLKLSEETEKAKPSGETQKQTQSDHSTPAAKLAATMMTEIH